MDVFQGAILGALGPEKPINTRRFLTFLLKFLKFQGDFPKSWRGSGPGRRLSGNQKSLKYAGDCSTFSLWRGGGCRAREEENICIFIGFSIILGVRAPEGPAVKNQGGPAGEFWKKNSPTDK